MPIADCTRVPASNRHWNGHLLLSATDDTVEHEASGHQGTYQLAAGILTIRWMHFPTETFLIVNGTYVAQSLTGYTTEIDDIAFLRCNGAPVAVRGVSVAVPLTSHEVFLRLGTSDVAVFRQIFATQDAAAHLPESASAIVDLGANIGLASVFLGLRYRQARLLAVEPERENFELLARNTAALGGRVRLIKGAAWTSDGETIPGYGLMTLLDAEGFDRVDILKVDIAGMERGVFVRGAEQWLPRVHFIIVATAAHLPPGGDAAVRAALAPLFEELPAWGGNLVFRRVPPTTLAAAGAVVAAIETPVVFSGTGTINLGGGIANADDFQRPATTASVNGFVLSDVICRFPSMLIYAGGRPIRETAYLLADDALSAPAPSAAEIDVCDLPQRVVLGVCSAWDNYYHWVAQCLPAMLAGTSPGPGKLLALPDLPARAEEMLHLLGLQDYPRFQVAMHRCYRFRSLEVSDFLYGGTSFQLSTTLRSVYRTMKDRVGAERLAGPKLYLPRRGAGHRRMRNEEDLIALLRRRGFEVIDPGGFTIAQQINLFRRAEAIVAPHGAALTNIGFCEPGTKVYELLPAGYVNTCFVWIGHLADLAYAADVGPNDAVTGDMSRASFSVDIGAISSRLDMLGL